MNVHEEGRHASAHPGSPQSPDAREIPVERDTPVEVRGLRKQFEDPSRGLVRALDGLDLSCHAGEIYGLLGPNGAGKTTTMRCLATILQPSAGSVRVAGFDVESEPLEVRRRIGFLSGSTGLYPRISARETLRYFGRLHGIPKATLEARIEELVAAFDMSTFADRRCDGLSTGQRQRVGIARAVLHDPPVLILDEPTTGLDVMAAGAMIDFIEDRRSSGSCILLSTHVLSEAERLCDRIGVIYGGRQLDSGTYDELCHRTGEDWLEDVFRALVREADLDRESGAERSGAA